MQMTTRAPDDFHLRVVVDRLARKGRPQREIEAIDLVVEGALPRELSGLYVRNGSNPLPGWSSHW